MEVHTGKDPSLSLKIKKDEQKDENIPEYWEIAIMLTGDMERQKLIDNLLAVHNDEMSEDDGDSNVIEDESDDD